MVGNIGVSPSEFWRMTPHETWAAINSYYEVRDFEFKNSWEQTRWLGAYVYNSGWVKKGKSPKELLTFPWESGAAASPKDIEQLRKENAERRRRW